MKVSDTSESGLESLIENNLLSDKQKYKSSFSTDYNKELCLIPKLLFEFIKETQPEAYATINKRGADKFLKRVSSQIKQKGIIDVLRKGVKDLDLNVKLYYKTPSSTLSQKATNLYKQNVFSITRQLYYSEKNKNSLDMAIFINGLPVMTLELKNQWTGQTVKNAIRQYQNDRDPKEQLFSFGRCMVHFAVDDDLIYMTTHMKGADTFFLPFNKGLSDGSPDPALPQGAGNPINPSGLKTDYLWKEVLLKENLSNIIENFAQIITETDEDTGKVSRKLIFPRYHQLKVVKKALTHSKENGVGNRYLIQHSAGSGKSNSITWLAHQLVSLHDKTNQNPVFDSVIVVTDRTVLDKQIRDNIRQFAQVNSVVEAITKGSKQLKTALEDGKKIIVTTVQKFPYIVEEIGNLNGTNFAIIIDEAHSSQSGDTAAKMNVTLSEKEDDDEDLSTEDLINAFISQRKMLPNASYFAFTATPKNKTLETFGEKQSNGKFWPFHLYSMKQAIEEEFILDVLKNYTTYNSYYKINKAIENDPSFDTRKAQKKLRAYVESHPHSIKEKAKVMIDHYQSDVRRQIKGKAKSMIVCKSIKNAIVYKQAFDEYLKEIKSSYKAIIAFSGKKTVSGIEFDESGMNGFPSGEIPKQFKKDEYRFLIVANKFQTGFDQPLLHTMYVDKKLRGVQAVQTLSRLNRAYKPAKQDTFVLDFFNSVDDIKEAFQPYFTSTILSEETDANKLNDLQEALDDLQVYSNEDVHNFTDLFFNKAERDELDPIIDACVQNYKYQISQDEQIDFLVKAKSFNRTYAFLSKLLSFNNPYWERLFWFLKYLIPKLKPQETEDLAKGIIESINMDSYRLTRETTMNIAMEPDPMELDPAPADASGRTSEPELDELSNIVKQFNDRFGIDNWAQDDKVKDYLFKQLPEEMHADEATTTAIKNSDRQNAKITSDKKVEELMQDVIFQFTDLYKKYTDDPDFKRQYQEFVFEKMWKSAQSGNQNSARP
jgi:type I restriction enzyme R subunit